MLLVRLDAIGDFILWLDAAKDIRKLFPQNTYELTLLGNGAWTSVAEMLPYFDAVWSIDRRKFIRNPIYRFSIMIKIRRAGFHVVIQPTFSREFLFGDAVTRTSGAREKIGSRDDCSNIGSWQKRISDQWYTRLLPAADEPLMELIRNAEFMRGLGLNDFRADVPRMPVHFSLPAGFEIKDYFVLSPGAGAVFRQWPISKFAELADRIYRATGWTAVICGSSDEKALGEGIERLSHAVAKNWCGKTTLPELIEIISRSKMLVGNETSAVHIAAAVGVPAICILGGGHYGRFVPYCVENGATDKLPVVVTSNKDCFGCNWRCIYPLAKHDPAPCIRDVSVDEVWREVIAVVDKIQAKDRSQFEIV